MQVCNANRAAANARDAATKMSGLALVVIAASAFQRPATVRYSAAVGRASAGQRGGCMSDADGALKMVTLEMPKMPAHLYEAEVKQRLEGEVIRWYISRVEGETVYAEVVVMPPRPGRGGTPTMCASGPDGWMRSCSDHLLACADHVVAAAAVLGENQRDEEEPGALSAGGCALANVGRSCDQAADKLEEREWQQATEPLADAASSLEAASANLEGHGCAGALADAAAALEDASSVTGCMSLAAAAGPSLAECGEALAAASSGLGSYAEGLEAGVTPAHAESGTRLRAASEALRDAGAAMAEAGMSLELGVAV